MVCISLDDWVTQRLPSEKSPNHDKSVTYTIKTQDKGEKRIRRICGEIEDYDQGVPIERMPHHGTIGKWSVS